MNEQTCRCCATTIGEENGSLHWYEKDLCSQCVRPCDYAVKPRSRRFKPNTRYQKIKHRFPDTYWQLQGLDTIFHLMDESSRYYIALSKQKRIQSLRAVFSLIKSNSLYGDLPF